MEQARKDSGWSRMHAALKHKISVKKLIQYEFAAGGNLCNLPLAQMLAIFANYGKRVNVFLTDLKPEDYDNLDSEEAQLEVVMSELSETERAYIETRQNS